jgi:eukaryotic-like serine/threonine-protein kinase
MQETDVNNRYSIVRALGGGGMARVCLAHDEVLGRDGALKVLRGQFADDEEFVERFKREARSAALSHLNIIQVYDRGETNDGASYIAMEYVPGRRSKNAFRGAGP